MFEYSRNPVIACGLVHIEKAGCFTEKMMQKKYLLKPSVAR
jgi:hypothetical protein